MPYEVTRDGCSEDKPYAVRKKGGGKVLGCHESAEAAGRQIAAIEANERHTKTAIKREGGMDFPPRDYAYVPDPLRPATWKLRLTETPGTVTEMQLRKAAAALSPTGFHGNKLQLPVQTLTSVKRRLLAEFRRLKIDDGSIPAALKETAEGDDFLVWKDVSTGLLRWFAVYSNNFRDNDRPSEIITEQSQKTFVELVDQEIVDYPELWLWHVKGTAWGKADWVAYADGFAMASGLVYPGCEYIAHNLQRRGNNRVSHGMIRPLLVYDPHDKSAIIFHVTHEISPLPDWAAANALTGFTILDEGDFSMPLPQKKVDFLKEAGLTDEKLAELNTNLKQAGTLAVAAGIQSKEASDEEEDADREIEEFDTSDLAASDDEEDEEEEAQELAPAKAAAKPAPKAKAKTPPAKEEEEDKMPPKKTAAKKKEAAPAADAAPEYVTREEMVEVLTAIGGLITNTTETIQQLTGQVAALTKELSELQADDTERLAATKEVTPRASLVSILSMNPIGKPETRVDGRSAKAKEGPVETEAPAYNGPPPTMVPIINDLMTLAAKNSRAN